MTESSKWDLSTLTAISVLSTIREGVVLDLVRLPANVSRDLIIAFKLKISWTTSFWLINKTDWTTALVAAEGQLLDLLEQLPVLTAINAQLLHNMHLPTFGVELFETPNTDEELSQQLGLLLQSILKVLLATGAEPSTVSKSILCEMLLIRSNQLHDPHPVLNVLARSIVTLFSALLTDEELIDLTTCSTLLPSWCKELQTTVASKSPALAIATKRWTTSPFLAAIDFIIRVLSALDEWSLHENEHVKDSILSAISSFQSLKTKLNFCELSDSHHRSVIQSMDDQACWAVLPEYVFSDEVLQHRRSCIESITTSLVFTNTLTERLSNLLKFSGADVTGIMLDCIQLSLCARNPLQISFANLEGLIQWLKGDLILNNKSSLNKFKFELTFTLFSLLQTSNTTELGKLVVGKTTYLESLLLEQSVTCHKICGLLEIWIELAQLPDIYDTQTGIHSTFVDVTKEILSSSPQSVKNATALLLIQKLLPFFRQMSHFQPAPRMLSRFTIETISRMIARLQVLIPEDSRIAKHFNLFSTATLRITRQNMRLCFDLFLRLKGMIFEYYIKSAVSPQLPMGTKDQTILQYIQTTFPDMIEMFSTITLKPVTADIITAEVTPRGKVITLTELIYSSSYERQKETATVKLKDYVTHLSRMAPELTFVFNVVGVDSQPALWMRALVQVSQLHHLTVDTPVWTEDQLHKLIKTVAKLGSLLFSSLHYNDQLEVSEQIRQAHSEFETTSDVPDVVIPAVGLSRKIDFMCDRLSAIRQLNIYPVHSTQDSVNQLALRWCTTAQGPFQNEAVPTLTLDDHEFLRLTTEKLEQFFFQGQLPVCCSNSMKFTANECKKPCCKKPNNNIVLIHWYCKHCFDSLEAIAKFIGTNITHVELAPYYMRAIESAEVAPVTTQTPALLSQQMLNEANANCFSISEISDWVDPFWRFPSIPLRHGRCVIMEPLVSASLEGKLAELENLRRVIRGTEEVTHLSNLIRRAQLSHCIRLGLPVCVYDSSHGTLILKQPLLSILTATLVQQQFLEFSKIFDNDLQKMIITPKKLDSDENQHSITVISNESSITRQVIKAMLTTCEQQQLRTLKKEVYANCLRNLTQWIVVNQFTSCTEKMSYMTASLKRETMLKRFSDTAKHIPTDEKSFPIVSSRVRWVENQWDKLSETWFDVNNLEHHTMKSHYQNACISTQLFNHLSDAMKFQNYSSDHLPIISAVIEQLCQRNGFCFSLAIQEVVRTVDDLINTKVGPATLAWRTLVCSPIQLLCTTTASRADSSSGVQVMLVCDTTTITEAYHLGCARTSQSYPTWQPIPNTTLSHSHVFRLDGRMIRQAIATPLYLLDNVISELQDDRHLCVGDNDNFQINWSDPEVTNIFDVNCSHWLSYCLTNRRALSGFLQGLRYALMNLSGVSWFCNGLGEKVSMKCFNSVDAAFVYHAACNINSKFGTDWFQSIFRLSVGSRKLESLIKSGALLDSALEEQTELLESSSEWSSPRLIGRGYHKSVKTALREVFKAYQFERSLNDYDSQMILVANKVSKAAFKYNKQFMRSAFCDGCPYGLWAARGYTKMPNECINGTLNQIEGKGQEDMSLDNNLESTMAVLIMTNELKLPSFSRRYMNVGAKLMRQSHPAGAESLSAWRLKLDLSLGLSAKSNSSSGVSKKLGNIDPEKMFKQQTLLTATKLQRLIKTEETNTLSKLLLQRGYTAAAAAEAAQLVVLETNQLEKTRQSVRQFTTQLKDNRDHNTFTVPAGFNTEIMEEEVKLLKASTIARSTELEELVLSELSRWLTTITATELHRFDNGQYKLCIELLTRGRELTGVIGDYLQPLLTFLNSTQLLSNCNFWDYGRILTRWCLACIWLPAWVQNTTGILSRSISEIDLLRIVSSNSEHFPAIIRNHLKVSIPDGDLVELLLFGLSTPVDPLTMLTNICNFGKPSVDSPDIVEVSAEVVIAFIAYCLPFANTQQVCHVEDVRLLSSIAIRPLKFCLARFRRSRQIISHRLPKPGRQKNLITVTQAVVANAQSGFSGDISQLARALNANLALTVLYYGRAAKAQVGPTRELPIRDPITDECLSFSEKVDEAICSFFEEEAITHPYSKKYLQDKMAAAVQSTYRTVSNEPILINLINIDAEMQSKQEFPTLEDVMDHPSISSKLVTHQLATGVNGLLDHSKWGPGHVASSFSAAMNAFTDILGAGVAQLKRLTYEGISLKDDELTPAVWHRWLSPTFNPNELPDHMKFQYDLWKSHGLTAIPRPGDMGQGMLHKASSLTGIACGYIRRHLLLNLSSKLGVMLTMSDQQGSDDRNCALIITSPTTLRQPKHIYEQTLSSIQCFDSLFQQDGRRNAVVQPHHSFQGMTEHFFIAADVCVSRAGNHELSVKCAWSRCFSEMNSRFINAFNTINPTVRDTAPVAQGPTFGSLSETMIDLFSRAKNAASCSASELILIALTLGNLTLIEKRYKLGSGDMNDVVSEVCKLVEGPDKVTLNPFLIPYAIGGYPMPTIDRLLFCSTQEDEVIRVQFLKDHSTTSTLLTSLFMKGLSENATNREPKYDDLIAEIDGTFNKLASPTFGVKRRIMQRGKSAQAKLSALLETVRDTLEQSDSFNYKYSKSEYAIIATMAPYLPAKTVVGDLQKMTKILQSPGLLRSMSDCDWTHLSWASSMIARGHVTVLPFEPVNLNHTFWSDATAKSNLVNSLAISASDKMRFHQLLNWLWNTLTKFYEDPAPVGYAPILLPAGKPKIDNPKTGVTLRHALLSCLARACILLSDQLQQQPMHSRTLQTPFTILNPISFWSGKLVKHSYALTAGVIRRSLINGRKKQVAPLFSDCQFKETEMPGMLMNPPIKAIFSYYFPREFVICQGRLPKAKSLIRDIEILNKHCKDQVDLLISLISQSSVLGRSDALDSMISQVVLSIWTNSSSILPKDIKALLPCSKLLGASKKLQFAVTRSVVHNVEVQPILEVSKLWDEKVAIEFMSELDSERQMGEKLQYLLSTITSLSSSLEESHDAAMRLFQTGVIGRTQFRQSLQSWLNHPVPFAVEHSTYGQTILLKKLAMLWFTQGYIDDELLCQSAQIGVVIHNFAQSSAVRPDAVGIHKRFNSASLSCSNTFISIVESDQNKKILVINPEVSQLTTLLRFYTALILNLPTHHRQSNRIMTSSLFEKNNSSNGVCFFSRDLIDLEYGHAPIDAWRLSLDSIWRTSVEPPWAVMSRLPQAAEFQLKSNPPRIELVTKYRPDLTFDQELAQFSEVPIISQSAIDMIRLAFEKCTNNEQFIALSNLSSRLNIQREEIIDKRTVLRLDELGPFAFTTDIFDTLAKSMLFPPSVLHSFVMTTTPTILGTTDDTAIHQYNGQIVDHMGAISSLYDVSQLSCVKMMTEPTRIIPSYWEPMFEYNTDNNNWSEFSDWRAGHFLTTSECSTPTQPSANWLQETRMWHHEQGSLLAAMSVEDTLLEVLEGTNIDAGQKAALAILSLPHNGIQIAAREMESWERESQPANVRIADVQADLSLLAMTAMHRRALLSESRIQPVGKELINSLSQCSLILQGVTNIKTTPLTIKLLANSSLTIPVIGALSLFDGDLPLTAQLCCLLSAGLSLTAGHTDWTTASNLMLLDILLQTTTLIENLIDKSQSFSTNYSDQLMYKTSDDVLISVGGIGSDFKIVLGSAKNGKFLGKLTLSNDWTQHRVRNHIMRVDSRLISLTNWIAEEVLQQLFPEIGDATDEV